MSVFSPIHHTFAPHVDLKFWWRRTTVALAPWKWRNGGSLRVLRRKLATQFNAEAFLFASGREAFCALLKSMELKSGEEVIIQGYTCVAVPNAIHTAGGVPVYVDIDPQTFNLSSEKVAQAITGRTRAVVCQHTFAIPGPLEELKKICDERGIALIEDCAHILPDKTGPQSIAQSGDFAFFSFGRDKASTGIIGGAVISRKEEVSAKLKEEEKRAVHLGFFTILRLLMYPCFYLIARPFYGLGIGKAFLALLRKCHLLVPIITSGEKHGHMSPILRRMPNAFAFLAAFQLTRHKAVNDHRRDLTAIYLTAAREHHWLFPSAITEGIPMQKFPLLLHNPEGLRKKLKKQNIHLHDGWTQAVICPYSVDQSAMNYVAGSCPNAEEVAKKVLTLPTHPTMTGRQARHLIETLRTILAMS